MIWHREVKLYIGIFCKSTSLQQADPEAGVRPCGQYHCATRSSWFMAGFSCWAEDTVSYFLGWVEPGKILSKAMKGSWLDLGEGSDTCVPLCTPSPE